MTVEASKKIRTLLAAAGYGKADVSVYNKSYSMGSTVYVTIKRAEVPLTKIEGIASAGESIDRDASGEIMSGGNTFVDVRYAGGALDAAATSAEEQINAGRKRFGSYSLQSERADELNIWLDSGDGTGRHVLRVDRQWAGEGLARVLASAGALSALEQAPEPTPEPAPEAAPVEGECMCGPAVDGYLCLACEQKEQAAAVVERMNEAAASVEPVRANSFLSPVRIIGAEQHELDYLGACIDNLVEPVRTGRMTAREALETMARSAFSIGFGAGHRYGTTGS